MHWCRFETLSKIEAGLKLSMTSLQIKTSRKMSKMRKEKAVIFASALFSPQRLPTNVEKLGSCAPREFLHELFIFSRGIYSENKCPALDRSSVCTHEEFAQKINDQSWTGSQFVHFFTHPVSPRRQSRQHLAHQWPRSKKKTPVLPSRLPESF